MIYSLSFNLLLIHLWIGSISCAVYHIVPSPDHHCPVEPCFTLSSFAANVSLYLESDSTLLIFLPGNHIIRSKFNVRGVSNFSMISYHSNLSRACIICEKNSKSGFIFNAVSHVHISNLKFFECYCGINRYYFDLCCDAKLITLNASSLVLVKCIFEDNVGPGLINAAHSNITIAHSTFKDNAISSHS